MALICSFTVLGEAKPQGSTKTITRQVQLADGRTVYKPVITHSNRESLMRWRTDVRTAIQVHVPQLQNALLRGPIAVRVVFAMTKPPSVPKRRLFPTVAPDCDKLMRAVGDALEHTVIHTDAQIVHWDAWKVYTDGRAEARIAIWQPDAVPVAVETNPFQQAGLF
jgi:Holliday junction resolvase RusA-like endonuclease